MNGNITAGAFKTEGIFETSNTVYDENCVFVRKSDLAGIMGMKKSECHEIAVILSRNDRLEDVKYGDKRINWKTWT
jgi:ABC-type lipoprotein release transport system permease subunit